MNMRDKIIEMAYQAKDNKTLPITVTNKDFSIIEDSHYVIKALENAGFKVETFADKDTKTYGIKVS